jgi:hypothetical protein
MMHDDAADDADEAHKDCGHHHHLCIAVVDMRQLMRQHRFKLFGCERRKKTARDTDRVIILHKPCCAGIQRIALNDLELRHIHAA